MVDTSPADRLLSGPRGRRLCWLCVDEQSYSRTGRYQLREVARDARAEAVLSTLKRVLADSELSQFSMWTDDVTLLSVVAESVDSARYWQDPDELDRALTNREVIETLRPVAQAIGDAPASTWWSDGVALDDQVIVDWQRDNAPAPRLSGAGVVLAEWEKQTAEDEERLRDQHISGRWWSPPIWSLTLDEAKRWGPDRPELHKTTRSLPELGALGLLLEEDTFGAPSARCRPVRCHLPPKICEIRGASDWLALAERYPIEVTWGRRGNWSQATGLNIRWLLPNWALVAHEYDAVHLSVMGYLATSGRALSLDTGSATFIAGWNPDETYWLTDMLMLDGEPREWVATADGLPRAWRPGSHDER